MGQFTWRDNLVYLVALSGRGSKILESGNGEVNMVSADKFDFLISGHENRAQQICTK